MLYKCFISSSSCARAIGYKLLISRVQNKVCRVIARANDVKTLCRVIFNEPAHKKKPLRLIFNKVSRTALRSTCSAERFIFFSA